MAEALLRRDLDRRGIDAGVGSAGLLDLGAPASVEVVELMATLGLDVSGHVSRGMTPEMLGATDLVLGLAREHVREAVLMLPARFNRTFTLKELVRRARRLGARPADQPMAGWLDLLAADRKPSDLLGASDDDDVADPIGQRYAVFKRTAFEIEELTAELVDLVWPSEGTDPETG
jgi:protein-tyrosine phosphatase